MPSLEQGFEVKLKNAQNDLSDAEFQEERKSQEFRLCPNCQHPFGILQRNCGMMVCGSSFRGTGCGTRFHVDKTRHYTPNDNILRPLRVAVSQEQINLQKYQKNQDVYNLTKSFPVPYLQFKATREQEDKFLPVPTIYLLNSSPSTTTGEEDNSFALLRFLLQEKKKRSN